MNNVFPGGTLQRWAFRTRHSKNSTLVATVLRASIQMLECIIEMSTIFITPPFPSNTHHRSSGDCLKVCSVQYCVQQLYTMNCTHIWTYLTVLLIGFFLTGPISCLDSFLCMYYFVSDCILHACVLCSIVTRWGGPGGIEAWSLGSLLPSVLWHCWLGHLTRKTRPDMTYNGFSGTLNPTQSINQSINDIHFVGCFMSCIKCT